MFLMMIIGLVGGFSGKSATRALVFVSNSFDTHWFFYFEIGCLVLVVDFFVVG